MSESAPLLTPREGADAPSRRVRIVRVIGASLLAAGAVVAVAGAFPGGRDAVALLRSGQMPSVSPAPRAARLGDGRWEELQQAQELMMAQEQQQIQADAQVAAVDQASFEDRSRIASPPSSDGAAAAAYILPTPLCCCPILEGLAIPGVPRGSLAMKEKWKGGEILGGGEEEEAGAYAEEPVFDMP